MAISTSPPEDGWLGLLLNIDREITTEQMIEKVDHETRKVYIDELCLYTTDVDIKDTTLFCRRSTFEKAQPEKWRDIQAKIALQKLKDS